MTTQHIHIDHLPALKRPFLIAGFDGWGNALDVSKAMVEFLVRKLNADFFARLDPDLFYRFDESRPTVDIQGGLLRGLKPPGASLFAARSESGERDLVIMKASEPNLRWHLFAELLLDLSQKLGVETLITLGSMYDNVLHSDRVISAIASSEDLLARLQEKDVLPINYRGPSAIHSTIHAGALKRGLPCISLWCHCPYYLQGTTHFGLLSQLGSLLSDLGGFALEMEEIDAGWKDLNKQIQKLIENNPEFQAMIDELRKAKVRGSWASMRAENKKGVKVIDLKDFLKPT
jgi:proteasome assembly chaperone (PAC2) family protein